MHPTRRSLLKTATGWLLGGSALLKSLYTLAAEWPKTAFESRKNDDVLQSLFGTAQVTPSPAIKITAPYYAENGATVRFAVSTTLTDVSTMAVLVEKNDRPLIASLNLNGALPFLSLRLKLAQTSDVYAIVKSGGKLFSARQTIKVTVGEAG
jgi:sulfur-oxidizing protein SoxY